MGEISLGSDRGEKSPFRRVFCGPSRLALRVIMPRGSSLAALARALHAFTYAALVRVVHRLSPRAAFTLSYHRRKTATGALRGSMTLPCLTRAAVIV